MKLEEKLTGLRREKGLTQLELAEAVHVTRQAVSRWEVGASVPTTENLAALSRLYGVSVDELLSDRREPPKKEPPPAEAEGAGGAPRRWTALALAALSLAVLILAACVGALLLSGREDAHDLSELNREEGVIPDTTFSLEGW